MLWETFEKIHYTGLYETEKKLLGSSKFYLTERNRGIEYGQANYGIDLRKYLLSDEWL